MKKVLSIIIDTDYNIAMTEETFKKELKKDFADFRFSDDFIYWLDDNYSSSDIFFLTKKEREEIEDEFINSFIDRICDEGHDRFHCYRNLTIDLED